MARAFFRSQREKSLLVLCNVRPLWDFEHILRIYPRLCTTITTSTATTGIYVYTCIHTCMYLVCIYIHIYMIFLFLFVTYFIYIHIQKILFPWIYGLYMYLIHLCVCKFVVFILKALISYLIILFAQLSCWTSSLCI